MRFSHWLAIAWLGAAGGQAAAAADLPLSLRDCAQQKDDARRLACFDHAVAEMRSPPAQDFSVDPEVAHKLQEQSRANAHEKVTSKVTLVTQRPHGELVITLDNGQVWLQLEPMFYFPLKSGDTITLSHGLAGSFWLTSAVGLATRVKRTR